MAEGCRLGVERYDAGISATALNNAKKASLRDYDILAKLMKNTVRSTAVNVCDTS